jgi:proteasome accessory factor C
MVPYFQVNPQVSYAKAANDLGVNRKQLEADINQLWICGMPGYTPGDLIDFELSDDTINVTFSAGIDRPLQLTSTEATGILMALRALAEIPGVVDPAAARSAIAKIDSAAGTAEAGSAESAGATESAAAAAVPAGELRSAICFLVYPAQPSTAMASTSSESSKMGHGSVLRERVLASSVMSCTSMPKRRSGLSMP